MRARKHIVERHHAVGQVAPEAADVADGKQLGRRQHGDFAGALPPTRAQVTMALAPTPRKRRDDLLLAPEQRQRRRDHAGAQHAEQRDHAFDRVGRVGSPPPRRSCRPSARRRRGEGGDRRGRLPRRSALRGAPSVKRSRLGGSISASACGWRTPARRNRSSSVAPCAARAVGAAEDHVLASSCHQVSGR